MRTSLRTMAAFGIPTVILFLASCIRANIIAMNSKNRTDVFYDIQFRLIQEIKGVIVLAEPENACSSIAGPPAYLPASLNCFVLIKGNPNECYFDYQVKNAREAGYSAAVIYFGRGEPVGGVGNQPLVTIWTENITAVLVTEESGSILKSYYLYTDDPGSRLYVTHNGVTLFSLAVCLGIVTGLLTVLALLFLLIRCIQLYRHRQQSRQARRQLKQLQIIKYTRDGPYETCAICLEEYKEKDTLRVLPCSHAYHRKCIDPWILSNHRTCPVCKQVVYVVGDVQYDSESTSHTEGIAETAPLLQMPPGHIRRTFGHGTFVNVPISVQSTPSTYQTGSGAGTSRDAPSEALDEDGGVSDPFRLSSSAPTVLMITSDSSDSHSSSKDENSKLSPHAVAVEFVGSNDELSQSSSLKEGHSRLII